MVNISITTAAIAVQKDAQHFLSQQTWQYYPVLLRISREIAIVGRPTNTTGPPSKNFTVPQQKEGRCEPIYTAFSRSIGSFLTPHASEVGGILISL